MLTKENLAERLSGIGASEIAAVAGLNPWASPLDVYERKIAPVAVAESEDMERGNRLEAALLDWTAARCDLIVRPNETLVRHPEHPFVIATPDGYAHERGDIMHAVAVVEVKSPGRTQADWTDPAEDPQGVPDYYLTQLAWQMLATGLPRAILSALVWGRLWVYRVDANRELQEALLERAAEFWRMVESRTPPPATMASDSRTLARLLRQEREALITPDEPTRIALRNAAEDYRRYREEAEGYDKLAEVERAKLCQAIGGEAGLDLRDLRVTWKTTKASRIVNWENVAREAGATDALIQAHTTDRPGSRRFLVSATKSARAKKEGGQ